MVYEIIELAAYQIETGHFERVCCLVGEWSAQTEDSDLDFVVETWLKITFTLNNILYVDSTRWFPHIEVELLLIGISARDVDLNWNFVFINIDLSWDCDQNSTFALYGMLRVKINKIFGCSVILKL